jgi:uncharacterized protein (TIGR03382 family)
MYVRLGQIPSFVQPASPTPLNDPLLAPQTNVRRVVGPIPRPIVYANYPAQSAIVPAPVDTAAQPASITASVSANPGSLTSWLQTGNNGIYAAIAVAVLLLLLTRRR